MTVPFLVTLSVVGNGDMARELKEYQMLVHLFGAISSPACANFSLQKTAEGNKDSFSLEVTNTVKRNFYVDDCLFHPSQTLLRVSTAYEAGQQQSHG